VDFRGLHTFEHLRSLGFGFGLNLADKSLTARGFAGSVVSSRQITNLRGQPWVYELTFSAPRGLSGAALMIAHRRYVCGCILGNRTTKMMVFTDSEQVKSTNEITVVERYEAMHLGIAIRADQILPLKLSSGRSISPRRDGRRGVCFGCCGLPTTTSKDAAR